MAELFGAGRWLEAGSDARRLKLQCGVSKVRVFGVSTFELPLLEKMNVQAGR